MKGENNNLGRLPDGTGLSSASPIEPVPASIPSAPSRAYQKGYAAGRKFQTQHTAAAEPEPEAVPIPVERRDQPAQDRLQLAAFTIAHAKEMMKSAESGMEYARTQFTLGLKMLDQSMSQIAADMGVGLEGPAACEPCEYCGAEMVQTHHDTWECGAACAVSTGQISELEWAAQAIEARRAATLGAVEDESAVRQDAPKGHFHV